MKLLSYEISPFHSLNSNFWVYDLTLEKSYFFGLKKKIIKKSYELSPYSDFRSYIEHWDFLIKEKKNIKYSM